MYEIPAGKLEYYDRWVLPLSTRLQRFRASAQRVAYYKTKPDNSSFRYRCYNMVQAIDASYPDISACWFHATDGRHLLDVAKEAEILVVHRSHHTAELAHLITVAKSFGTRVLFDVDDLVFDPKYTLHLLQNIDQWDPRGSRTYELWFAELARLRAAVLLCDGLIVTNEYLAQQARESLDLPVYVIPNFLSREQIDYSLEIVRRRNFLGNSRDEFLDLGYFSGTPTHNKDFAIAHGALARLMRRNAAVRLHIAGFLDLKGTALAGFEDRIRWSPLTDYVNLQRLIAQTEINIAPLQDTTFTNCKSELKFFDAAAVSVPTLASPTFAMSNAIEHGKTGLIVQDHEWDDALEWIVEGYEHDGIIMGERAYEVALATYTPEAQAGAIREVLAI